MRRKYKRTRNWPIKRSYMTGRFSRRGTRIGNAINPRKRRGRVLWSPADGPMTDAVADRVVKEAMVHYKRSKAQRKRKYSRNGKKRAVNFRYKMSSSKLSPWLVYGGVALAVYFLLGKAK